jgi:hypothetical protein
MKYTLLFAFLLFCGRTAHAQYTPYFPEELIVTASALKLRESPDLSAKTLATLPKGAVLQCLGIANNGEYTQVDTLYDRWYQVRTSNNKTGYIFGAFVTPSFDIAFEDSYMESIPPLNWYGVYMRDSFADEVRPVQIHLEKVYNEMFGVEINQVKTDQKEPSKFLFGSIQKFPTGYAGSLGIFDPGTIFANNMLYPGATFGLYPGNDINDTIAKTSWFLTAVGCADMGENYPVMRDFKVLVVDQQYDMPSVRQELEWFQVAEGMLPSVRLIWFGDLDHDNKPDCLFDDCPEEMNCRASLFLSSKAKPGNFLQKVCERQYPID